MIVRQLQDILNTERDVQTETWASRRLLLQDDGMGFSMHETTILQVQKPIFGIKTIWKLFIVSKVKERSS